MRGVGVVSSLCVCSHADLAIYAGAIRVYAVGVGVLIVVSFRGVLVWCDVDGERWVPIGGSGGWVDDFELVVVGEGIA